MFYLNNLSAIAGTGEGDWQSRGAAKKASILAQIPEEWRLKSEELEQAAKQRDLTGPFIESFLGPEEVKIVNMDSVPIVEAIRSKKLSCLQVTKAFCHSAAVAHQINNNLLEIFFDQAFDRAKELDLHYERTGTLVGPLHGLPISLKDQFHVKGVDTTMGYVGWIGSNLGITDLKDVHKIESQLTKELLSLGAVLYVKTSVPQTLMIAETKNNILGETRNPQNTNLSCGGSSGGEGALIALRGSTLGVGSDIGGSVRIPAAFNGLFGIKPTPERISYRDVANTNPGQNTYRSALGFLGTSLEGIDLIFRSVLQTQPWLRDPAVVPIPWRQSVIDEYSARAGPDGTAKEKPLKLGIVWTNNVVGPHPPIKRGMQMVVDAVRAAGHKVVDWTPPADLDPTAPNNIHLAVLNADGGDDVNKHCSLSGEPIIPNLAENMKLRDPMSLLKYQDLTVQGLDYECRYSDYWNSTSSDDGQVVDAIISPVAPHAAVIPGKYYDYCYSQVFNFMNYSSAAIPVTKANKEIDVFDKDYKPLSTLDKKSWEAYDAEVYDGAPVGVQIVGRKFEEEKALTIAKIVHAALMKAKTA